MPCNVNSRCKPGLNRYLLTGTKRAMGFFMQGRFMSGSA